MYRRRAGHGQNILLDRELDFNRSRDSELASEVFGSNPAIRRVLEPTQDARLPGDKTPNVESCSR